MEGFQIWLRALTCPFKKKMIAGCTIFLPAAVKDSAQIAFLFFLTAGRNCARSQLGGFARTPRFHRPPIQTNSQNQTRAEPPDQCFSTTAGTTARPRNSFARHIWHSQCSASRSPDSPSVYTRFPW